MFRGFERKKSWMYPGRIGIINISWSKERERKRKRMSLSRSNLVFLFLPLKFVIDGFVGSLGPGEFDRTTRNGDGRAQLTKEEEKNRSSKKRTR